MLENQWNFENSQLLNINMLVELPRRTVYKPIQTNKHELRSRTVQLRSWLCNKVDKTLQLTQNLSTAIITYQ